MKYIIMCGGKYEKWDIPRQLSEIHGETIIARTIRLLKAAGIEDIYITGEAKYFKQYGTVLEHENNYIGYENGSNNRSWTSCFYRTEEPVCYIFGDVVFSKEAIEKIVNTETDDIEFFASAPPFAKNYIKPYAEPFAFKVVNQDHLHRAIAEVERLDKEGKFSRTPIAWELWQVIKGTPINEINYKNYTVINDFTCDIDTLSDLRKMRVMI